MISVKMAWEYLDIDSYGTTDSKTNSSRTISMTSLSTTTNLEEISDFKDMFHDSFENNSCTHYGWTTG